MAELSAAPAPAAGRWIVTPAIGDRWEEIMNLVPSQYRIAGSRS